MVCLENRTSDKFITQQGSNKETKATQLEN